MSSKKKKLAKKVIKKWEKYKSPKNQPEPEKSKSSSMSSQKKKITQSKSKSSSSVDDTLPELPKKPLTKIEYRKLYGPYFTRKIP